MQAIPATGLTNLQRGFVEAATPGAGMLRLTPVSATKTRSQFVEPFDPCPSFELLVQSPGRPGR